MMTAHGSHSIDGVAIFKTIMALAAPEVMKLAVMRAAYRRFNKPISFILTRRSSIVEA